MGLNDLWFRDSRKSPDEVSAMQAFLVDLMGPSVGLGITAAESLKQVKEGHIWRGMETASPALLKNLQSYLSDYRMLTDAINLKPAYVINIGCNFDLVIRPNYTSQDVLARSILALQNFFNTNNWQINQPIILKNLYTGLDQIEGVQTVQNINIINKTI